MSGLLAAGKPANLRTSQPAVMVESDVFDICNRVKEIDPSLVIYANPDTHRFAFSIHELCADGDERFVCGFDDLDARILTRLQHMLHTPFSTRFAELERLEAKHKADHEQYEWDKFYENMGQRMKYQLTRDGFNDGVQNSQKVNKLAMRHKHDQATRISS